MAEPDMTVKKGKARWMVWALVASLGVNLFFLAAVVGAQFGHPHSRGDVREVGFGPFTEALSREDRDALRNAFIAAAPDFRDRRLEAAKDFRQLVAALRADPWDPVETEKVLETQAKRTVDRLDLGRRLMIERLAAMSPEERGALADRIEAHMSRRQMK